MKRYLAVLGIAAVVCSLSLSYRAQVHEPVLAPNLAIAATPTPTPTKTPTPTATPTYAPLANVMDYGALCDGTTDDSTAIKSAYSSSSGAVGFPSGRTCVYHNTGVASLELTKDTQAIGQRNAIIRLTGSCTSNNDCTDPLTGDMQESNAAVTDQTLGGIKVTGITFQMERQGCGCTLAIFHNDAVILGPYLHDVVFDTANLGPGTARPTDTPLAIAARKTYEFTMDGYSYLLGQFSQQLVIYGVGTQQPRVNGAWFNRNAQDPTNGVYDDSLYQIEDRQSNNLSFYEINVSGGPNGIWLNSGGRNSGAITGTSIRGSGITAGPKCLPWLPNMSYDGVTGWPSNGGNYGCVVPSYVATFTCPTNGVASMTVNSTANLYIGDWVTVAVASPTTLFTTQILGISGTTLTTKDACNFNASGGRGGYWNNYQGHIYRATTAGSSKNGAQPTWPVTHNGQVTEVCGGSCVTWTEYGEGAGILQEAQGVDIAGGELGSGWGGPTVFVRGVSQNGKAGTSTSISGANLVAPALGPAVYVEGGTGVNLRGNVLTGNGKLLKAVASVNSACTASGVPFSCCTGNTTGTCSGIAPTGIAILGNAATGTQNETVWVDSNTRGWMADSRTYGNQSALLEGPGAVNWINNN